MRLIVCLDDKNGMAFNHRRQSRDRIVTEKIEELAKGSVLRLSPYSAKLFPSGNLLGPDLPRGPEIPNRSDAVEFGTDGGISRQFSRKNHNGGL